MNKISKIGAGIVIISIIAVIIYKILFPKYWWAVTIASPIPPIP